MSHAETSSLYLQILAALGLSGGLIPILIKVVPKVVTWLEQRAERPLKQLREDYERRLSEQKEQLERKDAEMAKTVAKYDRLVEHLLRQRAPSSSNPPSSKSTSQPE